MRLLAVLVVAAFVLGGAAGFGAGTRLAPRPPAPSAGVARYMSGLQKFDGQLIWASYSGPYQEQRTQEGDSESKTVELYADLRSKGIEVLEKVESRPFRMLAIKQSSVYFSNRLSATAKPSQPATK